MNEQTITPKEFAKRMWDLFDTDKPWEARSEAEDLMCAVLNEHGYNVGVETFKFFVYRNCDD